MSGPLPSHVRVGALLRRVAHEGGSAMVLARGHDQAGAILVLTLDRGEAPRFFERGLDQNGTIALIRSGPADVADSQMVADYWQRRRRSDPDLWVVEVDIAGAERFAAETIL